MRLIFAIVVSLISSILSANAQRLNGPGTLNALVGGSSIGLTLNVAQTPTLTGLGINGSVLSYGKNSLAAFTPNAAACQNYAEACSHITAIGYGAANILTTSDHLTAVGSWAGAGITDNTAISNTALGIDTMRLVAHGSNNVMVGEHAGTYGDMQDGTGTVAGATFVGAAAGYHVGGTQNTAIGFQAMDGDITTHVTGNFNTALGGTALHDLTGAAAFNTALGALAGQNLTTGSSNTYVGYQAGQTGTTQVGGTFVGFHTGENVNATSNTGVGYQALVGDSGTPVTGNFNTAFGANSLLVLQGAAQNNTALGAVSGTALTTGSYNTLAGYKAGQTLTTGIQNVIIGNQVASTTLTTGSNNILIGVTNAIDTAASSTNNTINIGGVWTATGASVPSTSNTTIAGPLKLPGLASSSATTTGTLCWTTGTGLVNVDTTTTCLLSSMRFKHDWKETAPSDALAEVMRYKPGTFVYNDELKIPGMQAGFLAEDMAEVDRDLVVFGEDRKPLKIKTLNIIAKLAGAIQAQQSEINELRQTLRHN